MEGVRAMLGCMTGRRGRHEDGGYTELVYDDKMAELYTDDKDAEPYPQHEAMSYCPVDDHGFFDDNDNDNNYYTHGATTPLAFVGDDVTVRDYRTVEEVADEVAALLWRAEWNDDALQGAISAAVGDRRWNRRMVEECLDSVIEYVERGRGSGMGGAMCDALDKATDTADEAFAFPRRHPESLDGFIAIVSAGVLAELQGAWVLELLGFGEVRGKEELDGHGEVAMLTSDKIVYSSRPKPRTFAAWWTRAYDAYIPEGSVYTYLQRMDMVELED